MIPTMVGTDAVLPPSGQNRRRRRTEAHQQREQQQQQQQQQYDDNSFHHQYYDDSDDDDDDKGHRHDEERIFKGSCSFGQFVLNPCLCLFNAAISCIQLWRFRRKGKISGACVSGRQVLLLLFVTAITMLAITDLSLPIPRFLSLLFSSSITSSGRPLTDEVVNQIPIMIPISEFDGVDIGGWTHLRRFFRPTAPLDTSLMREPDFGDLSMLQKRNVDVDETDSKQKQLQLSSSLHNKELLSPPRLIHPDDEKLAARYWKELNKADPYLHSYDHHPEELEDRAQTCRKMNWAKRYYPSCNSVHEIALVQDYDPKRAKKAGDDQTFDSFYINHGYYRDVWVVHQSIPVDVKSVLKITRWKHKYGSRTYWNTLADAMVMERLTASPRIVDIYGHCGTAVWVEVCDCSFMYTFRKMIFVCYVC